MIDLQWSMCCGKKTEKSATFKVCHKVPDESTVIVEDTCTASLQNVGYVTGRPCTGNKLDLYSCVDKTLACDRQTDIGP